MNYEENEMSIMSPEFNDCRMDIDVIMQKLLCAMIQKNSMSGSISVKIDFEFRKEKVPDAEEAERGYEQKWHTAIKPEISHTVSYTMKTSEQTKGWNYSDDREIVIDEHTGMCITKPVVNTEQMNIYDVMPND